MAPLPLPPPRFRCFIQDCTFSAVQIVSHLRSDFFSVFKRGQLKLKMLLEESVPESSRVSPKNLSELAHLEEVCVIFHVRETEAYTAKMMEKYKEGKVQRMDWLDSQVFREIERKLGQEMAASEEMFLFVNFPKASYPILYQEDGYAFARLRTPGETLLLVEDLASFKDNPVEWKHLKLTRQIRSSTYHRDLKPNARDRDVLNAILRYGPMKSLVSDEKDMLWKFRYYLSRDKKALTKFLLSVEWDDPAEERQALELMTVWVDIDIADALELLDARHAKRAVREYAVHQLDRAADDDLHLYLLQLVQALRYENIKEGGPRESPLAMFLIRRAVANAGLCFQLYWYLIIETENNVVGGTFDLVAAECRAAIYEVRLLPSSWLL